LTFDGSEPFTSGGLEGFVAEPVCSVCVARRVPTLVPAGVREVIARQPVVGADAAGERFGLCEVFSGVVELAERGGEAPEVGDRTAAAPCDGVTTCIANGVRSSSSTRAASVASAVIRPYGAA
jgi:hypothetical protein